MSASLWILRTRLDALEQRLNLGTSSIWQQRLDLKLLDIDSELWERVWNSFLGGIQKQVKRELSKIEAVRNRLAGIAQAPNDAAQLEDEMWANYADIVDTSQDIFREWIEFLGGLAFREKLIDEKICSVADQLINDCSVAVSLTGTLTVPAQREARSRTLGRIVRVRFPEWNVWTLPFAAHEFGHVVVDESRELAELYRDLSKQGDGANGKEEKPGAPYVDEFLADAFATYALGPAYACAGVMLRFDPSSGDRDSQPSDAKRAFLVLEILKRMNVGAGVGAPNFGDVGDYLTDNWITGRDRSRRRGAFTDDDEVWMGELVESIWSRFEMDMFLARYPLSEWGTAIKWAKGWMDDLLADKNLAFPDGPFSKFSLANVLNAAWACRKGLEGKDLTPNALAGKVRTLGEDALQLCQDVVHSRRGRKASKGGRRPGGGLQTSARG
jgi:hypothetical protein